MHEANPEDTYGPRSVPNAKMTETYTNVEPETHKSSVGWIVPLALLAGLLGLIWYGASRSSVRAGRDDNGLASQTAREQAAVRHMATFEALMSQYQPVIDMAKAEGVKISNLTSREGKLILQATAPSTEAANKLWAEIKRINPKMDDIMADIKVDTSIAHPATSSNFGYTTPSAKETPMGSEGVIRTKPMIPESSMTTTSQSYVVKAGDTLSTISKQFYGNTRDYMRIFNANTDLLKNPNAIEVGQKLEIPMK